MNNSEKLLSAFSEKFFYKELVYSDLRFTPEGGTERELADLIINLEDVILAIQLKERNSKNQSENIQDEEKWLIKKCKEAKHQINDTIHYIETEDVSFANERGKTTRINPNAEIVPLVVFENDAITEYEHILKSKSNGIDVNCISMNDYKTMCSSLLSPIDIINYIKWRKDFYIHNSPINYLINDTKTGVVISKPQVGEVLVNHYVYEQYGNYIDKKEMLDYIEFNQYCLNMYEHTLEESEDDACYQIVLFLSHLYLDEIELVIERIRKSINRARVNSCELVGTLRNTKSNYAYFFLQRILQEPCRLMI